MDQGESAATLRPSAKIIPLRPDTWLVESATEVAAEIERGRRYLKLTLPSIPVAVFTLTFLLCYLIEANDSLGSERPLDPAPALLSAGLMTMLVGGLCAGIYSGFRHVTGLRDRELR